MDEMSDYALDLRAGRPEFDTPVDHDMVAEAPSQERDLVEIATRTLSRLAGYLSLAVAIAGVAYMAIR